MLAKGVMLAASTPFASSRDVPPVDPTVGRSPCDCALVAAAVLVIGGFALSGIAQAGQIFQQWDAVVSWNRWAVDWAANRLPYATSIYPQLLPTNLSLSYVFMQSSEVWIFAKAFQFLFCLMLLLAMLDLARVEGQFGYVPGVVITYGLLVALLRFRMLSSGYADVPLAFFALALGLRADAGTKHDRSAPAGEVFARWARCWLPGRPDQADRALHRRDLSRLGLAVRSRAPVPMGGDMAWLRRHLPALVRMCSIMGLLVLPWYLYKFFDFRAGCDSNNTALLVTDFHQGRDLLRTPGFMPATWSLQRSRRGRRAAVDCRGGLAAGSAGSGGSWGFSSCRWG